MSEEEEEEEIQFYRGDVIHYFESPTDFFLQMGDDEANGCEKVGEVTRGLDVLDTLLYRNDTIINCGFILNLK